MEGRSLSPEESLSPTDILDSDHPSIIAYASNTVGDAVDPLEQAVLLYYAVRDGIWYDPYVPFHLPEHYRASRVLARGRGFCVYKASLLCALGRACAIPTRLGFADVRNHLATRELIEMLGTDLFVFHGYVEFLLEGRWVKATPAFNAELCERHGVAPLEFNGRDDSVFHAFDREGGRFMEYVTDHGTFTDVPVDAFVAAVTRVYGAEKIQGWQRRIESAEAARSRVFDEEEVWKG